MNVDPNAIRWERRKKTGGLGPGQRSGCTTIYHKGKGVLFGGVSDIQEDEESIESVCHSDMFQLNVDSNKWYPFTLKKQKLKQSKKQIARAESDSDEEWAKFERQDELPCELVTPAVEVPSTEAIEPTMVALDAPCARFNTMMTVTKNTLYLFGGILEQKDREITLNDLWSLNLDKLNEWNLIIPDNHLTSEWFDESSDDDDSDDDEDEECSNDDGEEENKIESATTSKKASSESLVSDQIIFETPEQTIIVPDPLPAESLRDYFTRTQIEWQLFAQQESTRTGKALRRDAFELAQDRYNEKLPENELLRLQMEANEAEIVKAKEKDINEKLNSRYRTR